MDRVKGWFAGSQGVEAVPMVSQVRVGGALVDVNAAELAVFERMVEGGLLKRTGGGQGVPAFWFARAIESGGGETSLGQPYAASVWVQSAIAKIAGPVASVRPCFYQPSEELAGVPAKTSNFKLQNSSKLQASKFKQYRTSRGTVRRSLEDEIEVPLMNHFLRQPMEGMGYADFVEASIGWLKMAGECFWLIPDDGPTVSLPFPEVGMRKAPQVIVARPDRMRHVIQDNKLVGWEYRDGASKVWHLDPSQLVFIKRWNPYDKWRGLGEYESARIAAEGDWLAGKFSRNLMANNGDTGPYIIAKSGVPTDPQREQIIQDLKAKRAAQLRGDFKPIFLTGDITVEDPSVKTVDANFISMRVNSREEVYAAMNVPPSLAQVKESYSIGSASDFYQLITGACIPTGEKFADGLERLTAKLTGSQVEILLDWDEHPVMQEVRKERFASVDVFWNKGMPMAAVDEFLGLEMPDYEGKEIGWLPINVTPAAEAAKSPSEDGNLAETSNSNDQTSSKPQDSSSNEPVAAMMEALRKKIPTEARGDVEGHEFHGNQYTEAANAAGAVAVQASKDAKSRKAHSAAAKLHYAAAGKHLDAGADALQRNDMPATGYHTAAASEHLKFAAHEKKLVKFDKDVSKTEKLYDNGKISLEERERRMEQHHAELAKSAPGCVRSDKGFDKGLGQDVEKRKARNARIWEAHVRARSGTVRAYQSKVNRVLNEFRAVALSKLGQYGGMKLVDGKWTRANEQPLTPALSPYVGERENHSLVAQHSNSSDLRAREIVTRSLIDFIFDAAEFGKRVVVAINPVQQMALDNAASQLSEELNRKADPWKMPPPKALEFLKERQQVVMGCGATVRSQLNTQLSEGVEAGESIESLSDRVRGVFNNLSKFDSRRIAQTECGAAFGFARDEGMKAMGVEYKKWISSHGPNVRPAHAEAEMAEPVKVDEPFIVDGEELMYPGDSSGSPENIINCQCVSVASEGPEE